jgi:hypothetical protein
LVGPRTAVTPAPGALSWEKAEGEKAMCGGCFYSGRSVVIASEAIFVVVIPGRREARRARNP